MPTDSKEPYLVPPEMLQDPERMRPPWPYPPMPGAYEGDGRSEEAPRNSHLPEPGSGEAKARGHRKDSSSGAKGRERQPGLEDYHGPIKDYSGKERTYAPY